MGRPLFFWQGALLKAAFQRGTRGRPPLFRGCPFFADNSILIFLSHGHHIFLYDDTIPMRTRGTFQASHAGHARKKTWWPWWLSQGILRNPSLGPIPRPPQASRSTGVPGRHNLSKLPGFTHKKASKNHDFRKFEMVVIPEPCKE